jgi:nitroalkane oxidase
MAIDFTLSDAQRELQSNAREFAENVLGPVLREADEEPDPLRAFQRTKGPYVEAYKAGIPFCMLPREYGGGGLSNIDLIIAAEEICAVDPGFACTVLVNGLGLLPVWYYGTEEQKDRFPEGRDLRPERRVHRRLRRERARRLTGRHGELRLSAARPGPNRRHRHSRRRLVRPQRRKYWPCNVAGWDGRGANTSIVVVRTDPAKGGTEGLSAIMVDRGTPGVSYNLISKIGHRLTPNAEIIFDNARVPATNLIEGTRQR